MKCYLAFFKGHRHFGQLIYFRQAIFRHFSRAAIRLRRDVMTGWGFLLEN